MFNQIWDLILSCCPLPCFSREWFSVAVSINEARPAWCHDLASFILHTNYPNIIIWYFHQNRSLTIPSQLIQHCFKMLGGQFFMFETGRQFQSLTRTVHAISIQGVRPKYIQVSFAHLRALLLFLTSLL
jgi:hypothetical protein